MEASKLLRIISTTETDEAKYGLQSQFQTILTHYNSGDTASLKSIESQLKENIDISLQGNFVATDYKILRSLGADTYFGRNSLVTLDAILKSRSDEVVPKLTAFTQERAQMIANMTGAKSALGTLNLKAVELSENDYEIGFAFPEEYSDLGKLEDVLQDVKNFLNALASGLQDPQALVVTSVDNGCIEVFIKATEKLALHFEVVLEHTLKIYEAIRAFVDLKKGYQHLKDGRKATVEKVVKEQLNDDRNKIVDDLIRSLKIEGTEEQHRVKHLFKTLLDHLEKGVVAEVRTPALKQPEQIAEDATEPAKESYKRKLDKYKAKVAIDNRNREMFILQQNNFYDGSIALLGKWDEEDVSDNKKEEGK